MSLIPLDRMYCVSALVVGSCGALRLVGSLGLQPLAVLAVDGHLRMRCSVRFTLLAGLVWSLFASLPPDSELAMPVLFTPPHFRPLALFLCSVRARRGEYVALSPSWGLLPAGVLLGVCAFPVGFGVLGAGVLGAGLLLAACLLACCCCLPVSLYFLLPLPHRPFLACVGLTHTLCRGNRCPAAQEEQQPSTSVVATTRGVSTVVGLGSLLTTNMGSHACQSGPHFAKETSEAYESLGLM